MALAVNKMNSLKILSINVVCGWMPKQKYPSHTESLRLQTIDIARTMALVAKSGIMPVFLIAIRTY